MKSLPWVSLVLPVLLLSANAGEVKPGDAMIDVRLNLGAPRGEAHVGDREIFYYDRGEIEARAGIVTHTSLRSEAEQAALETKRSLEATRLREEREIRQARLNAEGEELKARKLADASFRTSPLSYQVAFWEDFSRRYPTVASAEPLLEARIRLAGETEDKRKQLEQAQHLAELEARVTAAENDARENRLFDQQRLGAVRGYSPYLSYSSYRGSRDYCPRPEPLKSVTRLYEYPVPYATSPGMPPVQPVYRKETTGSTIGLSIFEDTPLENRPQYSPSYRRF